MSSPIATPRKNKIAATRRAHELNELKHVAITIFFGGFPAERNISLDSARTFYDSIRKWPRIKNIVLLFVSAQKRFYQLHEKWIYANTIEDFETLLQKNSRTSSGKRVLLPELRAIIERTDVMIPLIHGQGGEDGWLTQRLERWRRRSIIGSRPAALLCTFHKDQTKHALNACRVLTPPSCTLMTVDQVEWQLAKVQTATDRHRQETAHALKKRQKILATIRLFFKSLDAQKPFTASSPHKILHFHRPENIKNIKNTFAKGKVVIKPNTGGSSDGVSIVDLSDENALFAAIASAQVYGETILIESCIIGKEFSTTLIENDHGEPRAFFPTEIAAHEPTQINSTTKDPWIYSRKNKYMPDAAIRHYTPARLRITKIRKIMRESEMIFKKLSLQDWARMDGFLSHNGQIIWHELNSIPGYGADGILLQQSSLNGWSPQQLSFHLIEKALRREGKTLLKQTASQDRQVMSKTPQKIPKIGILGGGSTSERQVSRMSWFNVINKLSSLQQYSLHYLFMDQKEQIWELPQVLTLKHTVEEIEELIHSPQQYATILAMVEREKHPDFTRLAHDSAHVLAHKQKDPIIIPPFIPRKISLATLQKRIDFLFIALHGGIGENGTLQHRLAKLGIPFNGSPAKPSALASDKYLTQKAIRALKLPSIQTAYSLPLSMTTIRQTLVHAAAASSLAIKTIINAGRKDPNALHSVVVEHPLEWKTFRAACKKLLQTLQKDLRAPAGLVFKPRQDGCSTGVWVFRCAHQGADYSVENQVAWYLLALFSGASRLPFKILLNQENYKSHKSLELPRLTMNKPEMLVEEFIDGENLIEITIGVFEDSKNGVHALLPSRTLAEEDVLTVDEKFHKGIGVNLTPPAEMTPHQITVLRRHITLLARRLGLRGYARIDLFYDLQTQLSKIIEINTLPGLTVATVLYTQALLTPGVRLAPAEFLAQLIGAGQKLR